KLAPDFLVALPDRVAFLVPGEFVGVDEAAWGGAGDDDPVGEVVAAAEAEAARRVPVGAAQVVEGGFGVVGQRVARLRLRPAEVERHAAGDAAVEGGRDPRRVAAPRDGAQEDDLLRVNALPREEQINAAA